MEDLLTPDGGSQAMFDGALAGLVATAPMTAVMLLLHRLLPAWEQYPLEPRRITTRRFGRTGRRRAGGDGGHSRGALWLWGRGGRTVPAAGGLAAGAQGDGWPGLWAGSVGRQLSRTGPRTGSAEPGHRAPPPPEPAHDYRASGMGRRAGSAHDAAARGIAGLQAFRRVSLKRTSGNA
jgi:hypothetical protein